MVAWLAVALLMKLCVGPMLLKKKWASICVYGIEDTRQALIEAKRTGVHPFCITIDKEGQEYLPHMYGAAQYVIIDEVRKLPLKVADIYRRLTS